MNFYSNVGRVVKTPFRKFKAEHKFGRNHFYSVRLPILDGVPLVERPDGQLVPADGTFTVEKSAEDGRYLIVPAGPDTEPDTVLAFLGDAAGFRGSCGLVREDTTAAVLCHGSTHAAGAGNVTVVALIRPGERVVIFSDGRRNDDRIVYENRGGKIQRTVYRASEYKPMPLNA